MQCCLEFSALAGFLITKPINNHYPRMARIKSYRTETPREYARYALDMLGTYRHNDSKHSHDDGGCDDDVRATLRCDFAPHKNPFPPGDAFPPSFIYVCIAIDAIQFAVIFVWHKYIISNVIAVTILCGNRTVLYNAEKNTIARLLIRLGNWRN